MKPTLAAPMFLRCAAFLCAVGAVLSPPASAPQLPTIQAFNVAAEATINLGATTSPNWSAGEATSATLTPGGDVSGRASPAIAPTATTTYVLTATNVARGVTKSKKITVIVPPVVATSDASPTSIDVR